MNAAPKERPILMSAPMVQASLRELDPKTNTRRAIKPQPECVQDFGRGVTPFKLVAPPPEIPHARSLAPIPCPYGVPGDRLWVKETYRLPKRWDAYRPSAAAGTLPVRYAAGPDLPDPYGDAGKLRPSIHMPRWASRLTLEITDVRVERLNKISEADAVAEGLIWRPAMEAWAASADPNWPTFTDPVRAYRGLWEHINGPGSWAANPWVWVVVFKRVKDTPAGVTSAACAANVGGRRGAGPRTSGARPASRARRRRRGRWR